MAIVFNNWNITVVGTIARQYDNLSRRIDVEGDLPDGYEWKLLLKHESGDADTILLEPTETGVGVVLTADNLAKAGHYRLQIRGVLKADWATVRHTNVALTYIPESLTGVGKWPELPTEFAQIEQRCTTAMIAAESAAAASKDDADRAALLAAEVAAKAAQTAQDATESAQAKEDAQAAQSAAEAARAAATQSAQQAAESAAVYDSVVSDVAQLKADIENLRFGDPYNGVDLTAKFADEIAASPYSGDAWAWIKARIQAGNYTGIHVKDFIPFTATNGVTLRAEVAGIDTYRNYGDSSVGRHIDFICRELWPTLKPINPVNYNNGLIPVENITLDGVATSYTLTKEMNGVASITKGGEGLTGWHYDSSTFTITFDEVPEAGTAVVTGTGTEHPWLACDLYHWLNSLSGQIPNGTGLNPAVKHVDYTQGGVYFYLPQALKNVIIEKRFLLAKRYSATGILSDDNSGGWTNIGKLWLPTEPEVYGMPVWGGKVGYSLGGSAVQYPIFAGNMNRVKLRSGSRTRWWLLSLGTSSTHWCYVDDSGYASSYNAYYTAIAAPVCFRVG